MAIQVRFKKVHPDAVLPAYATNGSAGFDFRAVIEPNEMGERRTVLRPGETRVIRTGLQIAIPKGYELQVRSRSGLAAKMSLFVLNSPGTIDSDYRGEVMAIIHNASQESRVVTHDDRIAQGVLNEVPVASIIEVSELDTTERGEGGLGSTGVK